MPFELPEVVRNRARAAGAEAWVEELPGLVAELEQAWSLRAGRALTGGTEALVVEATLVGGEAAVLKLLVPHFRDAARREVHVLELAEGRGCARLLRGDADRGALLIERLGPSMFDLGLPLPRRFEELCATVERLWRPAPDSGLPTGAEKGRWLVERISTLWEELGRPCSSQVVEHALACAERRIAAHDRDRAVLVHGDVHQWNALRWGEGFKLVDPDGLLAEAEYDLGILMREDPVELLEGDPPARARRLARRTGLDAVAIWEWGVVERVSTGLLATRIDLQPAGQQMLATAERVCGLRP